MATLWIREYSGGARSGSLPIPQEPGVDQTPVTFTTSVASAAFGAGTTFVRMSGSAAFHYVVATAPVATTSHMKVPADTWIEFGVTAGHKVAAIAAA